MKAAAGGVLAGRQPIPIRVGGAAWAIGLLVRAGHAWFRGWVAYASSFRPRRPGE